VRLQRFETRYWNLEVAVPTVSEIDFAGSAAISTACMPPNNGVSGTARMKSISKTGISQQYACPRAEDENRKGAPVDGGQRALPSGFSPDH
jgi:hypothetical protein